MLRSYFISAIRSIFRNKLFSIINILGLSIGIACSFLIILDIQDDLSYDQFFENKNEIYRVVLDRKYPENMVSYAIIPYSIGEAMVNDIPEVVDVTRIMGAGGEFIMNYGEKSFKERYFCFADSNFFNIFSIPLLSGDPEKVLSIPNGILLSESTAKKYFGDEVAIGKNLEAQGNELVVTGVFKDIPDNSHMKFDIIASIKATGLDQAPNYTSFSVFTYVKLNKDALVKTVESKLPALVEKYAAGQIETRLGVSFEEYTNAGNGYDYYLQPLTSIHLTSHLENEIRPNANKTYVLILAGIALFLVIIASINFMNLSTAKSTERAREVGLRKLVGSRKSQLMIQFLVESVVITFISLLLAVLLVEIFLPQFNQLAGKTLQIEYFNNWLILPLLLTLGIIIGVLAGSYPAFVLSSFVPSLVLKGKFASTGKGRFLRNALVVFQFWVSIVLIAVTLLIIKQMNYLKNTDMGFDKENTILIQRAGSLQGQRDAFISELLKNPDIISVGGSSTEISGGYYPGIFFQTKAKNSEVITSRGMTIDETFLETMNLELIEGRSFSKEFNDSLSLIINESAVNEFKLEKPIGAQLYNPGDGDEPTRMFTVIGIVKDFHYNSLHDDIKSFVLWSDQGPFPFIGIISVKLKESNTANTLEHIEKKWLEFVPDQPVSYTYLEENIYNMYKNEQITSNIFGIFSLLAILIACVGLFGLAAYTATKRIKEIGVRKVMGASVSKIVGLLSYDFTKLVLIAFILAIPAGFLFMKKWLLNFAYKTDISIWIFLLAGGIALFIALVTISIHSIRAANSNPADSLRYE